MTSAILPLTAPPPKSSYFRSGDVIPKPANTTSEVTLPVELNRSG